MPDRSCFLLLALALLVGCAARPPTPPPADPGPVRPADAWPARVLLRQKVSITWEGQTRSFDAAVQRVDETLTVVGLAPFGPPGFVIRHGPSSIDVENNLDRPLPFDPRFLVADVQKVFYPWLPPPEGGQGWVEGEVAGLKVRARYVDGRLAERRFVGAPPLVVGVRYGVDLIDGISRVIELRHEGFGYRLRIETAAVDVLGR